MVEAKFLLPFALMALGLYTADNFHRVRRLKRCGNPSDRARSFRAKAIRQFGAIVLMPAACLLLSQTFGEAMHPGPQARALANQIATLAGVSGHDLVSLLSPATACQMAVAIVVLEAIPLVLSGKSPLVLGNFAVLLPRNPGELIWCAVLALNAGLGEELLFRGFIPLGIAGLHVSFDAALMGSVCLFAACHVYQGPVGVLVTGFAGALLTATYVLTGSLSYVIAIHVAIDMVGLVIRPLTSMGLRRWFCPDVRDGLASVIPSACSGLAHKKMSRRAHM